MNENCKYGITVLYAPADSAGKALPTVFDLVAIHGLNGDAMGTWTHKQTRILWLRDLLPKVLPNVRIMTYGYNAAFRNFTAEQDIRSISASLLGELVDLRRDEEASKRPIVIVCHSLGGIVAKKALIIGVTGELAKVQNAVYGILFLATPHSGSSIASYGKVIAKLCTALSPLNPQSTILGTLQKDSRVLFEITLDFLPKVLELNLVSFYETQSTKIGFFKTMIVDHPSAILRIPHEVTVPQNSDHREIARFPSLQDRNFRSVLSRLETFRDDIAGKNAGPSDKVASQSHKTGPKKLYFETPYPPCDTFRGRVEPLNHMQAFFHASPKAEVSQLTFAICGLGGSGKTQTALKFATNNRHHYQAGVFFLTASTEASLAADLSRICDLLQLDDVSNHLKAFKEWLSQDDHKDWLLIFDNNDDLASVRLVNYIPRTSWGHVIVTSRDQAVIGGVAKAGYILERLEMHEAEMVLLQKSGIIDPSIRDQEEVRAIVELLGCLPLAVDQAGAYIRTRCKTFSSYLRLCRERQSDMLKFRPRLGQYEKSVFTTWEINFDQVERESKVASNLLLLFCFLDASNIAEIMLDRACSPQKRWNRLGERSEVGPMDSGIDCEFVALVQDEIAFDDVVEKLLSFSLIHRDNDLNGLRNFSIHPLVQYCAAQRVIPKIQDQWRLQAIAVVCQAFPQSRYLDPLYGNLGRLELPHVLRVLNEYHRLSDSCPTSIKNGMLSTLIAASRFSNKSWKREVISQAKKISEEVDGGYLRLWLFRRESEILRMTGKDPKSNDMMESLVNAISLACQDKTHDGDARWNAEIGGLIHSYAENLIQGGKLESARHELAKWAPLNPTSTSSIERIVARSFKCSLGRILNFQGHFQEALDILLPTFQESDTDDFWEGSGWWLVLLCNLAVIYIELNRAAEAAELVAPRLERMAQRGTQNVSIGCRLQLVLAESLIRRHMYDQAEEVVLKLNAFVEAITDPDMFVKRFIFGICSILARIAHFRSRWEEALDLWDKTSKALEGLGATDQSRMGLVQHAIAYALLKIGKVEQGLTAFHQGEGMLRGSHRRYWLVGFESYWRDYIVTCVYSEVAALGTK